MNKPSVSGIGEAFDSIASKIFDVFGGGANTTEIGNTGLNGVQGADLGIEGSDSLSALDRFAVKILDVFNPKSKKENLEYGGWIYRTLNGKLVFTVVPRDKRTFSTVDLSPLPDLPDGAEIVGDWHTHGDYSTDGFPEGERVERKCCKALDENNSDNFPRSDIINQEMRSQIFDNGSKEYRSYLGTPSGVYKGYNAFANQNKKIYVINDD